MENPSDDYNTTMAIVAAIDEINAISDIGKDEPSIENKPCTSDSQLVLDSILSTKHDNYPASIWHERKSSSNEIQMGSVGFLVIPAPTESETLQIEHQGTRHCQPRTMGMGVSMSETTVSPGENSTPFFPADCTTNADIMTPSRTKAKPIGIGFGHVLMARKASSKGETMPKSLPQYVRKSVDKDSRNQRIYMNNSPYIIPSSHLGVIQEEDEDNEN